MLFTRQIEQKEFFLKISFQGELGSYSHQACSEVSGSFTSTQFYADIEGHPDEEKVKRALDELIFFTSMFKILGVYECHEFRKFNS